MPSTCIRDIACICKQAAEKQVDLGPFWAGSLNKLVSSRFTDSLAKNKVERDRGRHSN